MPRLYFIRHGETDWNREGRLQGHTETALNARGRQQAALVARHLADLHAAGAEPATLLAGLPVYASPMQRTRQTAQILLGTLGLDSASYVPDDRLMEIGFGIWEGRTWPEIRARDPIGARDRDKDRWHFQPPGGESYAMVADRVGAWLASIDHDALVIAHGGIARVMMVLLGAMLPDEAVTADVWQGRILHFADGKAAWVPKPGHA